MSEIKGPVSGPHFFRNDDYPIVLRFYGCKAPEEDQLLFELVIAAPEGIGHVMIPPIFHMTDYLVTRTEVLTSEQQTKSNS